MILKNAVAVAPFCPSLADDEVLRNTIGFRFQDIPIVHFMRHDYFLALLQTQALRLKRLDLYEEFDGRFPAQNAHTGSSIDEQVEAAIPIVNDKQAMLLSQNISRSFTYIHCWFEGSPRDKTMWASDYGHAGKAVCISTTSQALQSAITLPPAHLHCELGRCTYRDETEAIPEGFSAVPLMRKQRKFAWEQEVRVVARVKRTHHIKDKEGYLLVGPDSETLPVDLSVLVAELVMGPNLTPDEVGEIIKAAAPTIPATRIVPL